MLANMGQQRRKKGDGGLYQATVHAHGGEYRYWMADWVDEDGKRHRTSGATPEEALARKNWRIHTAKPAARKKRPKKPAGPTVEQAAELWLAADQRLGETSRRKYLSNLRLHVFPYVGALRIKRLTIAAVSRMTELQRAQGIGESAAWHTWKTLHTMLAWAVRTRLIPENPLDLMAAPKRTNHRAEHIDRYIDDHTATALGITAWAADESSPIHKYYPLIMAMGLGLRRAEALGLTRDALDPGGHALAIRARLMQRPGGGYFLQAATKNGRSRVVPLPMPFYKAMMQAYHQHESDAAVLPIEDAGGVKVGEGRLLLVRDDGSPIPYNSWNAVWRHIQQAFKDYITGKHTPLSKAEYILPHEMRHITASLLGEQGETLATIQDVLGHLTPAMSEHYRHVLERSRQELAERWGEHIEAATKNFGDFYAESAKQMAETDSDGRKPLRTYSHPQTRFSAFSAKKAAPETR